MRIFWALLRRELGAYFLSLTGYVIIAAVALLTGLSFVVLVHGLVSETPVTMTVTEMFYSTFFFWLIELLVTPVITMRLFAQEKATGTFETLMTVPVGDVQVVLAKFVAAMFFYLVAWLPLLAGLFIVRRFTNQSSLDAGTIGGMFLGILLVGGLFLSLGCFASSLTRSQITAAMISFVLGVTLFSMGFIALQLPVSSDWQTQALGVFNLFDQMHDFARGVVDTRAVVFHVSTTFLFLFLTLRVVESRRWK